MKINISILDKDSNQHATMYVDDNKVLDSKTLWIIYKALMGHLHFKINEKK